jgi:hypothetical protein
VCASALITPNRSDTLSLALAFNFTLPQLPCAMDVGTVEIDVLAEKVADDQGEDGV